MDLGWWQNLTEAQAQIIASLLTGGGIVIGSAIGLGVVGGVVRSATKSIENAANARIKDIDAKFTEVERKVADALGAIDTKAEFALSIAGKIESEEQASEELPLEPEAATANFRTDATELVRQAQSYVMDLAEGDPDGRYRRTYRDIPPSRFDLLAEKLFERQRINSAQAEQAKRIAELWRKYQRGHAARRVVPEAIRNEIADALSHLRRGQ